MLQEGVNNNFSYEYMFTSEVFIETIMWLMIIIFLGLTLMLTSDQINSQFKRFIELYKWLMNLKTSREWGLIIRDHVQVRPTQQSWSMQLQHTMVVTLNDAMYLEKVLFKIRCSLFLNINLQLLSIVYDTDHDIYEQHFK